MKIYFSDIDDTLIGTKGITQVIDHFLDNLNPDEKFIPCSGRPTSSMIKLFKKYKLNYLIGFNGAQIYDIKEEKYLYNNVLTVETIKEVIQELEKNQTDYLIYDHDNLLTNNVNNKYAQIEQEICNSTLQKLEEIKESPKILGLINPQKADEQILILKKKFPNLEITKSKPFFLEITNKSINKGKAINIFTDKISMPIKKKYCFGDGLNDVSMFTTDSINIAVENAHPFIKEKADYITDSCDNHGVINFIIKERGNNE